MPGQTDSIAMDKAIEFEEQGKDFYTKALEKASNTSTEDVFKFLVEDEEKHLRFLAKAAEKLRKTGQLPEEDTIDIDRDFKMIFENLESKIDFNGSVTKAETEALDFAINLEKKGMKMYQELRDKSEALKEKALYDTLAKWEENHLKYLENTYAYYKENNMLPQ